MTPTDPATASANAVSGSRPSHDGAVRLSLSVLLFSLRLERRAQICSLAPGELPAHGNGLQDFSAG